MSRGLIKINLGDDDSHKRENSKNPYPEDKRTRAERRWKRLEMSHSLKYNRFYSATRTTAKISGKNLPALQHKNYDHMIEDDEVDDDYERYILVTYYQDNDETDEEYKTYLETRDPDIDSASDDSEGVSDVEVGAGYISDSDETDKEYKLFLETYDPDIYSDNDETDEEYKSYLLTLVPAEEKCESDEEYLEFLNSAKIVDGDLVEDGSKSSDSDIILIEPNSICENTPFISSKAYDPSWFGEEMDPRDGRQSSQFRKRLMEYLQRPFDQQEYGVFWNEVNGQKQKERHVETRRGVVKSYLAKGVNKSYLELYPDLKKAIAEFEEEPHRVLFLLRGFIFWLKNLCHEGKFRPWLDESCLDTLRKI